MRTKHTLAGTALVAAIALNLSAADAAAAYRGDSLLAGAHRIDRIAHQLEDEFRLHYRHLCAYRHLVSDVREVIARARHIDELAHDPHRSLRHIRAELVDLDRLVFHMHDVVDGAERGRYSGHIDGDTRHVHRLLDSLDRSVHAMARTVERLEHDDRFGRGGCDYRRDHHRGDAYGHSRSGVTYSYDNGRGFRIAFSAGGR